MISDDAVASGGAGVMMLTTARQVRQRGLPVTILSGEAEADPELAAIGIDVVSLGGKHILSGDRASAALRGLWDNRIAQAIRTWISRNDTGSTVYHLHNWHKVLSPAALAALRPVAPRLLLSAHDFFLACPNGGFFDYRQERACNRSPLGPACLAANCDKRNYAHKLWRLARHALRERAVDLATCGASVVAVHEGMLDLLARGSVPAGRITVLRNPFVPWLNERVAAEANDIVLYVGRIEGDKGIDVLAEAALYAGVRVCAVGDGPMLADIRRRHPEIDWRGRLDHASIAALARHARLLCLPTRVRETFGLVALEALGSGLPVIMTTTALLGKEVRRLGIGETCPPGDAAALERCLSRLAVDDAEVEAMSRRAFSQAAGLAPDTETWCDRLLDLYSSQLGPQGIGEGAQLQHH